MSNRERLLSSRLSLFGRAHDIPEGAKNAAVVRIGAQNGMAIGAFVEELTRVGGHLTVFCETALGACQLGIGSSLHELFLSRSWTGILLWRRATNVIH